MVPFTAVLDRVWDTGLVSTEPVAPDLPISNAGVIADGILAPPAKGDRAAEIRYLYEKYPEISQAAIARRVGCSESNVSQVLKAYLQDVLPEELDEFRGDKANICEVIQHRLLSSITQDKLDKTPAVSLITGFAIMEDKIRLMRGQPTSIHVHALVDVLDMLRGREEDGE